MFVLWRGRWNVPQESNPFTSNASAVELAEEQMNDWFGYMVRPVI